MISSPTSSIVHNKYQFEANDSCVALKILVSECTYICFWDSAMAIDDSLLNSETDGRKEVMTPFQWCQLFS